MLLSLDIQKKAEPIIRQTQKGFDPIISAYAQGLSENLNDLILSVEGFDNHIFALSKTAIKELLDETNKVIDVFVNIDENLMDSVDADKEIIERFKYSLKALYKLRSLLHIAYTKGVAVKETPGNIKERVSAISRASVLHNLSKHIQ